MTIYTASKTKHAHKWRHLRSSGYPIISTWIDEAEADESQDLSDLWIRCIKEASTCDALILYMEDGDTLKGAHAEAGAALSHNIPVFFIGPENAFSMLNHPLITKCNSIEDALQAIEKL